ncbi:hypothetical protein ACLOJK_039056 [Asimina triloba]
MTATTSAARSTHPIQAPLDPADRTHHASRPSATSISSVLADVPSASIASCSAFPPTASSLSSITTATRTRSGRGQSSTAKTNPARGLIRSAPPDDSRLPSSSPHPGRSSGSRCERASDMHPSTAPSSSTADLPPFAHHASRPSAISIADVRELLPAACNLP